MPTVLRPVAESLTRLPATGEPIPTAGPPFFVSRFLPLPPDPNIARLAVERLTDLAVASRNSGRLTSTGRPRVWRTASTPGRSTCDEPAEHRTATHRPRKGRT